MKKLSFSLVMAGLLLAMHCNCDTAAGNTTTPPSSLKKETDIIEAEKLSAYALQAKLFCTKKHCNTALCFLIDMSLPSGKNRFFVYDIKNDSVIFSTLVAHGSCNTAFAKEAVFSNEPGSGCSALGRYTIGNKYEGRFGTAYKLYGLDSTNNNAFERHIVLHSYSKVPSEETVPLPICNSLGCPMVSPSSIKTLSQKIDISKKPVLLWIFN